MSATTVNRLMLSLTTPGAGDPRVRLCWPGPSRVHGAMDDRLRLAASVIGQRPARTHSWSRRCRACDCFATHLAVLPRAADGCIARMIRKPDRARLTSDAALLTQDAVMRDRGSRSWRRRST